MEMKNKFFVIIFITVFPVFSHSMDYSVQYYLPTLLTISSGGGAVITRFKNSDSESRFLIPVELKISALQFEYFTLSGNTMVSYFIEENEFSSLNMSLGISLFYDRNKPIRMTGWFLSLYPVYELPVIAFGKEPILTWRMAADHGYSLVIFDVVQFNIYVRYLFLWLGSEFGAIADVGITVGVRLP
jgi:hypothetical protein